MKVKYVGIRTGAGCEVWVSDEHGVERLQPRFDLRKHSPTGFEWGYGGSGPAQLALALLARWSGNDRFALNHYQDFKFKVVGGLPFEGWELTGDDIRKAITAIRAH